MKKAKAPGYQRYPKDFLADTALMTAEQVGAYQLMLDYAWIGLPGFKQGQLPADDESLAKLTRVTTEHWKEIKNIIINCFIFVAGSQEKSPYFEHKRIKRDLLKQRNYRKQQSKKGKLSAEKRWGEGNRGYPSVTPSVQPKSKSSSSTSTTYKEPPLPPAPTDPVVEAFVEACCLDLKALDERKTGELEFQIERLMALTIGRDPPLVAAEIREFGKWHHEIDWPDHWPTPRMIVEKWRKFEYYRGQNGNESKRSSQLIKAPEGWKPRGV